MMPTIMEDIEAKVYLFYNWKRKHITFMFMQSTVLTHHQLEDLHELARGRMGEGTSIEVYVG